MTIYPAFNNTAQTAQNIHDDILIAAVRTRDTAKIEKALADGANPNTHNALPLRIAASNKDYLSAKTLMLHNADSAYAEMCINNELSNVPRTRVHAGDVSYDVPATGKDQERERQLYQESSTLREFREAFLTVSLPQAQINLLRDIQTRLTRLEAQMQELTAPSKLEKNGKLPAPSHLKPAGA